MHMPIAAISSSAWMAVPPMRGKAFDIWSKMGVAGVMGYPAKKLQPESKAAIEIACEPLRKYGMIGLASLIQRPLLGAVAIGFDIICFDFGRKNYSALSGMK